MASRKKAPGGTTSKGASSKGAASKRKGKVGEREVAELARDCGFPSARRGQQRSGVDCADVIGIPGVHVEVKRTERLNLRSAVAQARRDANTGEIPAVLSRWSGGGWLAVVPADWLFRLLAAVEAARAADEALAFFEGTRGD